MTEEGGSKKTVEIIGVPLDLGANMRGANMGPAAIRIAGIWDKIKVLGYNVIDRGDLVVPIRECIPEEGRFKYFESIISTCEELKENAGQVVAKGSIPLVLGGDHSIALGTIFGVNKHFKQKKQNLGVIWIDAHADLNTHETSHSGNVHGMPLAALIGQGHPQLTSLGKDSGFLDPTKVVLLGIRTLDEKEKGICKRSGIRYFTMREIDERGMRAVMEEAISVASNGTSGIHLSVDMDGIDPLYAPGVSTPVTGGLSYREAHLALEMLHDSHKMCSMEFVELNPMNDVQNKTAILLVELVQSTLGKSIV
jgi:arginase